MTGRRCGGVINLDEIYPIIEAADQVACEFEADKRKAFLVQGLRTERPGMQEDAAKIAVDLWLEGWGKAASA